MLHRGAVSFAISANKLSRGFKIEIHFLKYCRKIQGFRDRNVRVLYLLVDLKGGGALPRTED